MAWQAYVVFCIPGYNFSVKIQSTVWIFVFTLHYRLSVPSERQVPYLFNGPEFWVQSQSVVSYGQWFSGLLCCAVFWLCIEVSEKHWYTGRRLYGATTQKITVFSHSEMKTSKSLSSVSLRGSQGQKWKGGSSHFHSIGCILACHTTLPPRLFHCFFPFFLPLGFYVFVSSFFFTSALVFTCLFGCFFPYFTLFPYFHWRQ
jgi:hypothetical protein